MFPSDGKFEVDENCVYNICLCYLSSRTNKIPPLVLALVILELVLGSQEGQILACICILPNKPIPLMWQQRLKQPRGLCLPFCLVG